jgi:hypothetical protein
MDVITKPSDWRISLVRYGKSMGCILGFNSLACQESALHGLGHWQRDRQRQVNAIIDGFLDASPDIDSRLITYAHSARCGCVL